MLPSFVSFVFQKYNLLPNLTAADNIAVGRIEIVNHQTKRRGAAGLGGRAHDDMRAAPHLQHGGFVPHHNPAQTDRFQPLRGLASRQRCAGQVLGQTAVHEFQRDEGPAILGANFVDLDDVGMLETGHGFGLGAKPSQFLRPRVRPGQDHLESDQPIPADLSGFVDDPHAAPP